MQPETGIIDPFNRITAKEANLRATKQKENAYKERLKSVYGAIHANVSLGLFETEYIINGFEEADYVFNQLVMKDEYAVTLGAVNSDPDDERMKLTISWDFESLIDPNKKYILPMDDATSWEGEFYYAAIVNDHWSIAKAFTDTQIIAGGYTVTAKDIEDAPEWVKAIEPVEV
jgi:hypothetical protein